MKLRSERTGWIFILGSGNGKVEKRFLYDIAFGVMCLEHAHVPNRDILVFIDKDGMDENDMGFLQVASNSDYSIHSLDTLFETLRLKPEFVNLVFFVTGHGCQNSIVSSNPISPHALIQGVKSIPGLKNAILYLGQCYAGIFNYLNVGKQAEDRETPEIVVIGATNLAPSISVPVYEDFRLDKIPWSANLFLHCLFLWFRDPKDIDGDSKNTIMDSFKWAGMKVNELEVQRKISNFSTTIQEMVKLGEEIVAIDKEIHTTQNINSDTMKILELVVLKRAKEEEYNRLGLFHLNLQQPWILNARPAQMIEF